MITKYFDATVEGHRRIAVVSAETDDIIAETPEAGNPEVDLPADFSDWKRYTAHTYGRESVEVMSRDGD